MNSNTKSLRELCNDLGVSRRAVQGYEKAGLVAATDRNKYGHLLYDVQAQKRIETIKLYQRLGFHIREIKELIDAPGIIIREALEQQVLRLKEERTQIDELVRIAQKMIDTIYSEDELREENVL